MKQDLFVALYVISMGALIVLVDVLFLRDHFWWRLGVNVGIVLVFVAAYLLFFRNSVK